MKKVVVTGGAGQISYSLLFRLASGELLGKEEPISLRALELPASIDALKGVGMELNDCAFPLLEELVMTTSAEEAFDDADIVFFVGAKPRGPGMERGDLLAENGKIFGPQGQALNKVAKKTVIAFVVGNPCNTNALVLMHNAPDIPQTQFHAMTRLDQNRASHQLAEKSGAKVTEVRKMAIWGNHSSTQVPDFSHAEISGKPAVEVITDHKWLQNDFITTVQKRGAAIIDARGKSSAASAASAAIDGVKSLLEPTALEDFFSSGVISDGNPYGIADGLIFSFPLESEGAGRWRIIDGLECDDFLRDRLKATEKELIEERDAVRHLLK